MSLASERGLTQSGSPNGEAAKKREGSELVGRDSKSEFLEEGRQTLSQSVSVQSYLSAVLKTSFKLEAGRKGGRATLNTSRDGA